MDLLPKTKSEFSSSVYWEKFFKKIGSKSFEWYGEYVKYCGILAKYITSSDKILIIGCGNSQLGSSIYDVGYKNITSIDNNSQAIQQMIAANINSRPGLIFQEMDIFEMSFKNDSFSVVLDKGTLDAIFSEDTIECQLKIEKMFLEISRVLRIGGRYICISLAQPFIARKIVEYFSNEGFMTRVCIIENEKGELEEEEFFLPIFVFILTKFKKMTNVLPIFETVFLENKKERVNDVETLLKRIKNMQDYAMLRQQLTNGMKLEDQLEVSLYNSENNKARYTIYIVDGSAKKINQKFAIFIVPQGRELEWMFFTREGRQELHKSCGFQRLLVVLLSREHVYDSLDQVKQELSSKLLELAPSKLEKQSPFLTLGNSINLRKTVFEGKSKLSGLFIVEDVHIEDKTFRRLIFVDNPSVTQSEALITKGFSEKKKMKSNKKRSEKYSVGSNIDPISIIDYSYLSSQYYAALVAGLCLLSDFKQRLAKCLQVLLMGLGGGSIAMYLHKTFTNIKLKAVEIDTVILEVAEKYFGLKQNEDLQVKIEDGMEYLKQMLANEEKTDVLIIDIDNKDNSLGISCPPIEFIEMSHLKTCSKVIHQDGLFILNLACRNKDIREQAIENLKEIFPAIYSLQLSEDINELLYCFNELPSSDVLKLFNKNFEIFHQYLKSNNRSLYFDTISSVNFKTIKML